MYADLLKYFAIALLVQIVVLILCAAAIYGLVLAESNGFMPLVMIVFIVYAWPMAPFGFGGGFGIIISAPVLVVIYSLIFSVVKIRLRDRHRAM